MYTAYAQVCRGTKRLKPAELAARGRLHVSMMTDNPAFPDPTPSLDELAHACDVLAMASQVYSFNKGRPDLSFRKTAYQEVKQKIAGLAGYVQSMIKGDHALAMSAGFTVKKKRQPSVPVQAPRRVVARRTLYPGRIELRWSAVKHRQMYEVQIRTTGPGPEEEWARLDVISNNHLNVEHLQSDVFHTFRVIAYGALGASPVSDIASAKPA
ncbi:MAG: fibronectin type III domain-containing protein [Flavobacteriales bacterium]|nr:fibronectin type III domain-containing protein [Flavobacteriales bacterium]